jgi:hypothetical protein
MLTGLIVTIVPSLLMVSKAIMGLTPRLDLAKLLAGMMGPPDMPFIGWIAHFPINFVVDDVAISSLNSKRPGTSRVGRGLMVPTMTPAPNLPLGVAPGWIYPTGSNRPCRELRPCMRSGPYCAH